MMKVLGIFLALILGASSAFAIDIDAVTQALNGPGLTVEIHGVDRELERYVGTVRGQNFFDYQHFALTSDDKNVLSQIAGLKRHDVVLIKGDIPSPQRPLLHIVVTSLEIIKEPGMDMGEHQHNVVLPKDLEGKDEVTVKVHSGHPEGRMIVGDWKDSVLPILVPRNQQAQAQVLARGDLVTLKFEVRTRPQSPVHFMVQDVPNAIQVLESMMTLHGQEVDYEGDLVLFPTSPQVNFNVFALQREIGHGLKREYTIVNFDDPNLFKQLREKMQTAWDQSSIVAVNDRNKLLKSGLKIRAKGTFNFVDNSQANPQILIKSLGDIELK